MERITRRNFVANSIAAGAAAAAVTGPALAAQDRPVGTAKIKIVAVSCSPRAGKTTATSLRVSLQAAAEVSAKIETELIELAGLRINGNLAAGIPLEPNEKDDFPALVPKLKDPNVRGIIIGTPVYFSNMSSLCKAFLDRCIALYKDNCALSNKVAGVLAVGGSRNGGQEVTIQSVQSSLYCQKMIVVGNGEPGPRSGARIWSGIEGGVDKDEYGMSAAKSLGRRVAELALQLGGSTG
ncbi:MAG: flavodoxin family protein [Sedimentisphaerales bacterium]|nr:flavodoxin family protein [Sedimentisphaerales bacterium]